MALSNAARLTDRLLASLDLVTLSIDSPDDELQRRLGRALPGEASYRAHIETSARRVLDAGCRLKLNTVVTALNAHEDVSSFILKVRPAKWKPLQFVTVVGENEQDAAQLEVHDDAFAGYVARHQHVAAAGIWYAPETADVVRTTYVMIDPTGRVFQHSHGRHVFSRPVTEVGLGAAMAQVGAYDREAFVARGGHRDVRSLPVLSRTL